jgi:GTP-binding protein
MEITSAEFVKGIVASDVALENNFSQVAFIGRSNAGKSSIINSLVRQKNLARSSNSPGRTQQINLFLINNALFFLDLPGYGYAKASKETRATLQSIIFGYLFKSEYKQKKVIVVTDARTGPTELDLKMIKLLEEHEKNILILVNKFDKLKPSERKGQLDKIKEKTGPHPIIAYSATKNIGRKELIREIL